MNCIGDACEYFDHHQFRNSYRTCLLENVSFKADIVKLCRIDKVIESKEKILEDLKLYKNYINNHFN